MGLITSIRGISSRVKSVFVSLGWYRERDMTFDNRDRRRLAAIEDALVMLQEGVDRLLRAAVAEQRRDAMAQADIDRLKASVARNGDAIQSGVVLIQGLAQQIRDAGDDPAELAALADQIDSKAAELAKAVVDNTPSSPSP